MRRVENHNLDSEQRERESLEMGKIQPLGPLATGNTQLYGLNQNIYSTKEIKKFYLLLLIVTYLNFRINVC